MKTIRKYITLWLKEFIKFLKIKSISKEEAKKIVEDYVERLQKEE